MREIKFRFLVEQTIDNRFNYAFDMSEKEFKESLEEGIKSYEELDEIRSERYDELEREWNKNHSNEEIYTKRRYITDEPAIYGYGNIIKRSGTEVLDVMQYTGLKDKNGTEIYEGDIVEVVFNGKLRIFQVVFDLSELDFKATNGKEDYGYNFVYLTCCDEVRVIGNIYENPELLKEGE